MPKQDVERLSAAFESYAAGDFDAALQNVHPEFEVYDHTIPDASSAVGPKP